MKFTLSLKALEALDEIAALVARSIVVEDVYAQLAEIVAEVVPNEGMIFNLLNSSANQFKVQIRTGDIPPYRTIGHYYDVKGTFVEAVVTSARPQSLVFTDIADVFRDMPGLMGSFRTGYRSWMAVPVFVRGVVIGTLHVLRKRPISFSSGDMTFMERVAIHVGATAGKHQMLQQRSAEQLRSECALSMSKLLAGATTLKDVIAPTAEIIDRVLPIDRFAISRFDHQTGTSREVGIWGTEIPNWDSIVEKPLDIHSPAHFSLENRAVIVPTESILSADPSSQPGLAFGRDCSLLSMMSAALAVEGEFKGTISIRSKKPNAYSDIDLRFFQEIAAQLNQYIAADEARANENAARAEIEKAKTDRTLATAEMEFEKAKIRVIDSVSHELRTPLTVITARADLLSRHLDDPEERVKTGLKAIQKSAAELKVLIDRLIQHADRSRSMWTPKYEDVSFRELEEEILRLAIYENSIELGRVSVKIPDSKVSMFCDKQQIIFSITELIDNAGKYGPAGEDILVNIVDKERTIRISVTDQGRSVNPDAVPGLFHAFERGDSQSDSSTRGAGLGLPFVSMVAQSHSGEVWFEKGTNGTSVFGMTLPFAG